MSQTILVVDDDEGSLRIMVQVLRHAERGILTATTGEEGVKTALRERPDIIVMDIVLPGMDGVEAVRRLRASGIDVPIIAVTSSAMPGDRERILGSGFDGYIEKPYEPRTVLGRILELAEKRSPEEVA